MPVVVKKRLLDLLQDNQQNYYELFVFFLDPDISSFEKEKKARDFLVKEIDKINEIDALVKYINVLSIEDKTNFNSKYDSCNILLSFGSK